MKCVYIKSGDVVSELQSFGPTPIHVPAGGPETFTGSFLQAVAGSPAFLVSFVSKRQPLMRLTVDCVEASTYYAPRRVAEIPASISLFLRLLRFRPEAIVCVRDGWALWAAFLATKVLRIPFVHSRQRAIRVASDNWRRRLTAVIDGIVIRRADRVICHGPFTHQQLRSIGVDDARIIEFDVQLNNILRDRDSSERPNDAGCCVSGRRTILFLGRLEASKGVYELLEASIPVLRARSDVDLTFVGGGGAFDALRERIATAGLSSRIKLVGRVPHEQVGIHLRGAYVLVTPTRHGLEGWPMAALEGLAVGVPVIAPQAGPFPFMITRGVNGLLFEVNSVTDLRRTLEQILDDTLLRASLARGALEYENRRAASCITFGDALNSTLSIIDHGRRRAL